VRAAVGPYTGLYGRIAGSSREECARAVTLDAGAAEETVGDRLWVLPAAAITERARGGNDDEDYQDRGGRTVACVGASIGLVTRAQLGVAVNAAAADASEADAWEADAPEADHLLGGGTSPSDERTDAFAVDFLDHFAGGSGHVGVLEATAAGARWNLTAPAQRIGYARATRTCGPRGNHHSYPPGTFTYLLRVPPGPIDLWGHTVTLHARAAVIVTITSTVRDAYELVFCVHASPWPVATPPVSDDPYGDRFRDDGVSTTVIIASAVMSGVFLLGVVFSCCLSCTGKGGCCGCCCGGRKKRNAAAPVTRPAARADRAVDGGGGGAAARGDAPAGRLDAAAVGTPARRAAVNAAATAAGTVPHDGGGGGGGGGGSPLPTLSLPSSRPTTGPVAGQAAAGGGGSPRGVSATGGAAGFHPLPTRLDVVHTGERGEGGGGGGGGAGPPPPRPRWGGVASGGVA